MRAFFKSRGFKVLSGIFIALVLISAVFGIIGKYMAPQSSILGAITLPIQKAANSISKSVTDLFKAYDRVESLENENNELRAKLREQTSNLIDFDKYKYENGFLYDFLEIKEDNPDYKFTPAKVSAKDTLDYFGSFTIDKGTVDGISAYDPVITADGLVGYIGEAGLTFSKVYTIFDPKVSVGSLDSRTRETGVVSGTAELSSKGLTKMSYLSSTSSVTIGDYIITSGTGGVFPDGILIGTVESVLQETSDISVYAVVKPAVDFSDISEVMVITQFEGQGSILN